MPIVVMPTETALRLKDRLLALGQCHDVKMFRANDVVLELQFTDTERKRFGNATGPAIVVAIEEISNLIEVIPSSENGILNYIEVKNSRAIARLDPFCQTSSTTANGST